MTIATAVLFALPAYGQAPGDSGKPVVATVDANNNVNVVPTNAITLSSTNVGIGTTTPSVKLDVVGQVKASGGLCIASDCRTSWPGGTNPWTLSGTNVTYAGGNVGVGTSSPSALLNLYAATNSEIRFNASPTTNPHIDMWRPSVNSYSGLEIRTAGTADWLFGQRGGDSDLKFYGYSFGSDVMTLRTNGNVGVGTSTPSAKLTVKTAVNIDGEFIWGYRANGTVGYFLRSDGNGDMAFNLYKANGSTKIFKINNSEASLTVDNGLMIGNDNAPYFKLQIATDSAGKPNGGSWADTSDARIKRNVTGIDGALDKLTQLRGVHFNWRNPEDHAGNAGVQGGFIAQEVERVFPTWVTEVTPAAHDATLVDEGDRIKALRLPFEFDAYVVEAIKELKAKNDELAARNRELESRMAALEALLAARKDAK